MLALKIFVPGTGSALMFLMSDASHQEHWASPNFLAKALRAFAQLLPPCHRLFDVIEYQCDLKEWGAWWMGGKAIGVPGGAEYHSE